MAIPFSEIVTSPIVQFSIGPKKQSFNLHLAPIAAISEPLDCIADDAFGQARNKHHDVPVQLENEDPDTFARFAEYLYTRNYTDPESKIDLQRDCWEDSTVSSSTAPEDHVPSLETGLPVAFGALTEEAGPWEKFTNKYLPTVGPVETLARCSSPCENYGVVLVGHVKVYIFAQEYEVEGLADLAMKKLHTALCTFQLHPERVPDISKMLRFVHLNLRNASDPLRALVMEYTACVIMELMEDLSLLVDGPPSLTMEIFALLKNRINKPRAGQVASPEELSASGEESDRESIDPSQQEQWSTASETEPHVQDTGEAEENQRKDGYGYASADESIYDD